MVPPQPHDGCQRNAQPPLLQVGAGEGMCLCWQLTRLRCPEAVLSPYLEMDLAILLSRHNIAHPPDAWIAHNRLVPAPPPAPVQLPVDEQLTNI